MSTKRTSKPKPEAKLPDLGKEFVQVNKLLLEPFISKYRGDAMRDELEGQLIKTGIAIQQLPAKPDAVAKSLAKLELIKLEDVVSKALDANPGWTEMYIDKKELSDFFTRMKRNI